MPRIRRIWTPLAASSSSPGGHPASVVVLASDAHLSPNSSADPRHGALLLVEAVSVGRRALVAVRIHRETTQLAQRSTLTNDRQRMKDEGTGLVDSQHDADGEVG